jgi:hypothetical protein
MQQIGQICALSMLYEKEHVHLHGEVSVELGLKGKRWTEMCTNFASHHSKKSTSALAVSMTKCARSWTKLSLIFDILPAAQDANRVG